MLFDVRRKHLQGSMLNEIVRVQHNDILSSMPYQITDCQFHEGDRTLQQENISVNTNMFRNRGDHRKLE